MNKEIIMELEILFNRMKENSEVEITFSKLIYSITNNMSRSELFNLTDNDIIKHIRKIQLVESC